jgi:large subunit ribosomal protein L17
MRHRKKFNHLSRKTPHRKAMLANMASSLILHKRIKTTTAKAKALRSFLEPVITRSKEDSTHSRRMAFKHLRDKEAVTELFRDVAGKIGDRPGGYTRIIKLGNRLGDNADMCIIELVDYNENLLAEKAAAKQKTTRRRRGGKKKAEQPEGAPVADTVTEVEEEIETIEESTEEEVETTDVADTTDEAGDVTETADAETMADTAAGEVKPEPEAKSQAEEVSGETEEDIKEEDDEEKKEE